ncbi:MAG: hypothetical protein QOE58_2257 [Actinomycetota bacterium]|jgi:hypothetical protein|nr:hypothetical protein [Actinomycetota bacterium]
MPGTAVIDSAVGLAFTFFLVALTCSALVEFVANLVRKRSKYLLRGLRDLLDTPAAGGAAPGLALAPRLTANAKGESALYRNALGAGTATAGESWTMKVMGHSLVRPFKQSGAASAQTRNPSYLPAKTFAGALVDLLVPNPQGRTTVDDVRVAVIALDRSIPFRGALLPLLNTASDDLTGFMASVEQWYDDAMDRVGGSYKRWAKRWAIVIALLVAIGLQVDTIAIGDALYTQGPLREAVAAAATNQTLCPQGQSLETTRACVDKELAALNTSDALPFGWGSTPLPESGDVWGWLLKILGWGLTAMAASFGAPFWFAALTKLGSLRNTGTKPVRAT